jgi:hypothetical protein
MFRSQLSRQTVQLSRNVMSNRSQEEVAKSAGRLRRLALGRLRRRPGNTSLRHARTLRNPEERSQLTMHVE